MSAAVRTAQRAEGVSRPEGTGDERLCGSSLVARSTCRRSDPGSGTHTQYPAPPSASASSSAAATFASGANASGIHLGSTCHMSEAQRNRLRELLQVREEQAHQVDDGRREWTTAEGRTVVAQRVDGRALSGASTTPEGLTVVARQPVVAQQVDERRLAEHRQAALRAVTPRTPEQAALKWQAEQGEWIKDLDLPVVVGLWRFGVRSASGLAYLFTGEGEVFFSLELRTFRTSHRRVAKHRVGRRHCFTHGTAHGRQLSQRSNVWPLPLWCHTGHTYERAAQPRVRPLGW